LYDDELKSAADDALLRIHSVDAREVLRLLFRSIVEANSSESPVKWQTRINCAEKALFGKGPRRTDRLEYEEVMLFMYRKLLEARVDLGVPPREETSTKERLEKAEDAAELALDFFHPDLVEHTEQTATQEKRRHTLVRRYVEKFYGQRRLISDRYYELLYQGDEARIVAEFLVKFLSAAGLAADTKFLKGQVVFFSDALAEKFEEDLELQYQKSFVPKKST
jgi:hypothetical protein